MAGEEPSLFAKELEEFRRTVESVSGKGNVSEKAVQLLKKFKWEQPVGLPDPELEEEEEEDEEEQLSDFDEEITEFYNKHVHVTENEFQVSALHVNFILEYLQNELKDCELPFLKFGKFIPYGAASEGMSSLHVPYFDILLPVKADHSEDNGLDVIVPNEDATIPAGYVKLSVKGDTKFPISKETGGQKREIIIVDNDESGRFLSPTGFREYIVGPLIEGAIGKLQGLMASSGNTFRVFLQKTKKSLDVVVEPNKSWLSVPIRQTSLTLSIVPSVCVANGDFSVYATSKPRYWKNLSATDPHNPLWQLVMPHHEHHLLNTLVPKDSYIKQALRVFKTVLFLRMKKNSDSTLIYLNSYHYKMALLSYLTNSTRKLHPTQTIQDTLAEFVMLMLCGIKGCKINSVFFANDEIFRHFANWDHSILQGTAAVNVADTLTAGIASDVRKQLPTALRSYDWGTEVWTRALKKEAQEERLRFEMKNAISNQEQQSGTNKTSPDGDLEKNLADDSIFMRIIGISVVILLLAVVVYSIFGDFEFGSSQPEVNEVSPLEPGVHQM